MPVVLSLEDQSNITDIISRCIVDRVFFVTHILGVEVIEPWQLEVLHALDAGVTRISIRSGHGVGKTALCAWCAVHFVLFRDNVKIPVTAPSSSQMKDGLIPEINYWISQLPDFLRSQLDPTKERVVRVDDAENNFISFRTARAESPEALAGIHATHVMAIVDEASGVPDAVYEAAQGTMSTKGAIFILIGNPTRARGYFFKTHTTLKRRWWTRRVRCHDSSRVDSEFVELIRDTWGVDSNQWRVRILGEFPAVDKDTLIPYELVASAIGRDVVGIKGQIVWGVDPGRGGDPTGFIARQENVVYDAEEWGDADLMMIVGRIYQKWKDCPDHLKPSIIMVDSIGLGAGVADRLRELGLPCVDVNVAETKGVSASYPRLRAEIWYKCREWFDMRDCVILLPLKYSSKLLDELTEPEAVFTSNGKNDVETKQSMKDRGVPSPNLADSLCMTFAFTGAVAGGRGRGSAAASWSKELDYMPAGVV